jgi:hypothetical protein
MAMPLRLIYNIKVSFKQKLGLIGVFSLGVFMIVFAIIRANQSLAQQGFVNLTLLMVWSTLAAAICKFYRLVGGRLGSAIPCTKAHRVSAVLVGTLPALKVLITTNARSSANRSGASGATSQATSKRKSSTYIPHTKSVALGSLRRDSNKTTNGSRSDGNESQEEILVQRDVVRSFPRFHLPKPFVSGEAAGRANNGQTVSYSPVSRPSPMRYQQRYNEP